MHVITVLYFEESCHYKNEVHILACRICLLYISLSLRMSCCVVLNMQCLFLIPPEEAREVPGAYAESYY